MRILFGSHNYNYVGGPGGVMSQILDTKAALERLGHQVTLLDPWAPFAAASYDIFHLFCAGVDTYELSLRMKQAGLKLVVNPIIDKVIPEWIIKASNIVIRRIPKVYTNLSAASELCKLADLTVARSAEERHKITFALGGDPSRVAMVPSGVDIKFSDADRSLFVGKHGIRDFVLWVGLIGDPNKNLLRLIRIVGRLPLEMVVVGPVRSNDYAKRCLEEAGKYKNIRVLGILEEAELISAYAAADTLVLPSYVEGTGKVALEAGLAGAKVVITKNGGPPDLFADLVEYVDPRSDESIRQKLLKAVGRPKDDRLKDHVLANFTWERVAPKLTQAYNQLFP